MRIMCTRAQVIAPAGVEFCLVDLDRAAETKPRSQRSGRRVLDVMDDRPMAVVDEAAEAGDLEAQIDVFVICRLEIAVEAADPVEDLSRRREACRGAIVDD